MGRLHLNMRFQDEYTSITDKDIPENKDKKIISDDAHAIGVMLDKLIFILNTLRVK